MQERGEKEKGGHPRERASKWLLAIIRFAQKRVAHQFKGRSVNPTVRHFDTAWSFLPDEAALILVRFYKAPPAGPGGPTRKTTFQLLYFWNLDQPDSTFSLLPPAILVKSCLSTLFSLRVP